MPSMANEDSRVSLDESDYQWSFADESGASITLDEFKDEVIFLNFWATWCGPCIAELPEIQKLYDAYGDKVKFILLTNESPADVNQFLSSRDYDLPVYYSNNNAPAKLASNSIPTTFIIAKGGSIVDRKKGGANWHSKATFKIFDALLD